MPPARYSVVENGELIPELLPGAHLILLVDEAFADIRAVRLRLAGFSFRDTLAILTPQGTLLALLFRAVLPSERNVVESALHLGTAFLNVAKSSISDRYPANVLLVHASSCTFVSCSPECPVYHLDRRSGILKSGFKQGQNRRRLERDGWFLREGSTCYGDSGGASRFYRQFQSVAEVKAWLIELLSRTADQYSGDDSLKTMST
jgi:hypothetical protein